MKKLKIDYRDLCALIIIAGATILRVLLLAHSYPALDSDEGTMGLMAYNIAFHGEHPIFFYGQGYMGALEAYLAAGSFQLFGVSVFSLRLGLIPIFALFMVSLYLLSSFLFSKGVALISLLILSFGSFEVLFRQLEAAGGYPESLLFDAFMLLSSCWLALSAGREAVTFKRWRRLLAYAGWGCLVGVALWSDLVVIPFVVMSCILLVRFCYRELRLTVLASLALGFLVGYSPSILYSFDAPAHQGLFKVVMDTFDFSHTSVSHVVGFFGTMLVSLPIVTGGNPICPLTFENSWPLSGLMSSYVQQCTAVHGVWGVGVVILGVIAAGIAIRHYWKLHRVARVQAWTPDERRDAIRYFGRLMLIGSAGLAFVLYVFSASSALTPWYSARYLIGVMVAVPALISPLCQPIVFKNISSIMKAAVRVGLLLLIGLTFVKGTIDVWGMTPSLQQSFQQEDVLIQHLEQIGATRVR